ncbi:MAG: hypothetical protein Q4P13_01720, partial [Psychrobacter sp.]|nr:hypothetical protein [Psychrobacter sp.]
MAIINDGLYLIGVTAGIYLMLSLGYEGPSVQMIGNTAPYWVLVISLALLGYLIYVQLKSRKNLVVGIDNLDEIKEDIGDYDLKQCCPNCQSQRMQDLYFFKNNHAKDLATTLA